MAVLCISFSPSPQKDLADLSDAAIFSARNPKDCLFQFCGHSKPKPIGFVCHLFAILWAAST
jgi:hypothetical protein